MSAPRRCARVDPRQRLEQILVAANRLFAERGYEEASIEDVARAAGVTPGLVHHYCEVITFHADIAQDSPRLQNALECWTGLNRAATRRWLRGEASRETTQELLVSTLEHVLRTFGSPPRG